MRGDRPQQIDQRHVADVAHEAVAARRRRLGAVGRRTGDVRRQLESLPFAPLQQRARPRHHLLHVDRFHHEVVGAGLEAARLALEARIGDQHHRRRQPVAGLFDPPAEGQPFGVGGAGYHQVRSVGEPLEGLFVVAGEPDGEPGMAEAQIEDATNGLVLLDDEDHLHSPRLCP